jgi:hypothetical protein
VRFRDRMNFRVNIHYIYRIRPLPSLSDWGGIVEKRNFSFSTCNIVEFV